MNIPRFRIRGFREPRDAVLSTLGPLERKVLDAAWGLKRASVREVVDKLESEFAYTTIMTTLDRLYKKGYLDREMKVRAFLYSPRVTQEGGGVVLQNGWNSDIDEDFVTRWMKENEGSEWLKNIRTDKDQRNIEKEKTSGRA